MNPLHLMKRLLLVLRRYDRRFWMLVLVQLIVAVGFGAAMPFVSLYLHTRLGVPMTLVGTILLTSALVASGGRIVGGEVADRLGRRPVVLVGMVARVVVFALMAVAIQLRWSVWAVAAIFLMIRMVGAVVRPGLMAMVSDVVLPENRVEAFALFRIGTNAGWAIGPAVGGFMISVSYASVFALTTIASLIGLVLVMLFVRESIQTTEPQRFALRRILDVGKDVRFLIFCGWGVLLFVVMAQFASTLAVFSTQDIGITESQLGWLFTVNGIFVVLFQWPAARLAARVGIRGGLALGCLGYAAGYFTVGLAPSLARIFGPLVQISLGNMVFSVAPGFAFLVGSMMLITLGEVVFSPVSMAAVANMAPAARMGRYMGFFGLTEALGWSLGPFIGGALYDRLAIAPIMLWGIIALIGITAAAGFALTQKRESVSQPQTQIE
ncbi:MFS transporter [Candidatus Bipolaricaulota bacterium]|nr:MFS transporter [Candidatus Bipolaricaulota bacterium]